MKTESHHKGFITYRRAGCSCGHIIEAVSRKDATQKLINHILHPASANKIADGPEDHRGCTIEQWNDRWGVCQEHTVYIDMDQANQPEHTQLELELGA